MKVLYDSNIYIRFLRSGEHQDLFTSRHHIRYLSSVVAMELLAGSKTPESRRALDKLFLPYSKAQRLVSPEANHYYKAGECLARLSSKLGEVHLGFSHDVLIAVSAVTLGATLFTENKRDFQLLKEQFPLLVEFL